MCSAEAEEKPVRTAGEGSARHKVKKVKNKDKSEAMPGSGKKHTRPVHSGALLNLPHGIPT